MEFTLRFALVKTPLVSSVLSCVSRSRAFQKKRVISRGSWFVVRGSMDFRRNTILLSVQPIEVVLAQYKLKNNVEATYTLR